MADERSNQGRPLDLMDPYQSNKDDLTKRVRLFELSQEMQGISTVEGAILDANPALERTLGFTVEELREVPYMELVHPDDLEAAVAELAKLMTGGSSVDYRVRMRCRDGSFKWTEWSVTSSPEDGLLYSMGRDVTERKKQEDFKDRFIADAAHELRTPIAIMVSAIDLITRNAARLSSDQQQEITTVLRRQGDRAITLIQNLLNLSRLKEGRLAVECRPITLAPSIKHAITANPAPEGKSVRVDVDNSLAVSSDPARLDQIVTNLLTNAYRYGGSNISVSAHQRSSAVALEVSDDGPGVPTDLIPILFEPFSRGDDKHSEGSGLGLAISHMLMEACRGTLDYETTPEGARFIALFESA